MLGRSVGGSIDGRNRKCVLEMTCGGRCDVVGVGGQIILDQKEGRRAVHVSLSHLNELNPPILKFRPSSVYSAVLSGEVRRSKR